MPTLASSAAQDFFISTMAAIAHLQHMTAMSQFQQSDEPVAHISLEINLGTAIIHFLYTVEALHAFMTLSTVNVERLEVGIPGCASSSKDELKYRPAAAQVTCAALHGQEPVSTPL